MPSKIVSTALHVLGGLLALSQLVMLTVLSAGVAALPKEFAAAQGSALLLWLVGVPTMLATQALFSAVALVVENTSRSAAANEVLAATVARLDLERTTDGGLYYRIR